MDMVDDEASNDFEARSILSTIRIKYVRHIVQIQAMFLFLYGASRPSSPVIFLWKLDPIQSFYAMISRANLSLLSLIPAMIMIIAAAIIGRAFCGWICPMGFIQDIVSHGKTGKRLPDQFRQTKYIFLTGGLLMTILSGWTFLDWLSPMPLLTQSLSQFLTRDLIFHPGVVILLFTVLLTIVTEKRAWCRHVCPLGAALSLFSTIKIFKIRLDNNKCIKCLKCDETCSMGVCDIEDRSGLIRENECILCMNCRDVCPVDAIKLR